METVCAWCLGVRDDAVTAEEAGQGICASCTDDLRFRQGSPLSHRVESLLVPVLVVDREGIIQAANTCAYRSLDRGLEGAGHPGDVFDCANARLPEGCGRTEHCTECAIRRAFTQTLETGRPASHVPATLRQGPEGSQAVDLEVTTARVGSFVILRVDRMGSAHPVAPGEGLPRPEPPPVEE